MARDPSLDVDPLYTVPLAEFTRQRDALAARLKAAGRRDEAAAVRRMKRPSAPVWAINTLACEHPDAVRAFVDATDRLKRAQLADPKAATAASRAQRQSLQALVRSTEAILRRGRVSPTARTLQRISGTLLGAATGDDARADLLRGRLTEERQAPGFEALTGAPSERRPHARLESRRAAQARAAELAAKAQVLEAEAAARERAAAEAARAVTELERQLRQAEARARELRREARAAATAAARARRKR
jgi:hypothetical protein